MDDGITYPNLAKKSISSLDFVEEIAEHSGRLLNDGLTLLHASRDQPFLPLFLVVQMEPDDVVTDITPKLLVEAVPEFPAFSIDLSDGLLVFGIGSSHFHPNSHDRTGKGSAK